MRVRVDGKIHEYYVSKQYSIVVKLEIWSRTEADVKERCFFTTAENIPPVCRESFESSPWSLFLPLHIFSPRPVFSFFMRSPQRGEFYQISYA